MPSSITYVRAEVSFLCAGGIEKAGIDVMLDELLQ